MLINSCITQYKAQGPSRICNESKEEEKKCAPEEISTGNPGAMSVIDSGLVGHSQDLSGRGAARAEDAQGTPTQSGISPSIIVYEYQCNMCGLEKYV